MPRYIFLPDIDHFPVASESLGDIVGGAGAISVRWAIRTPSVTAQANAGEGTLQDIPIADKTVAVIPLARIAFIDALLPQVSSQKQQQLLNFAIEDKLTIDPETVHAVVVGAADSGDNQFVVAAIDKSWLGAAIHWLTQHGIAPQLAVPETALHTVARGEWLVVLNHATGYAVRPDGLAYGIDYGVDYSAADLAKPPFALTLALNEAAASANSQALPARIVLSAPADIVAKIDQPLWQASLGEGGGAGISLRIDSVVNTVAGTVRITATDQQLAASNLLTGTFAPASRASGWLPAFKPALALAAVALLIQLTAISVDAWRVANQRRALEDELKAVFLTSFPEATTVVNAPLQMSRNLQQLRRERGLAQDEVLAQLALAATLTKNVSDQISNVTADNSVVTIRFNAIPVEAKTTLEASAKTAGASLTEAAGKPVLTIRAAESR